MENFSRSGRAPARLLAVYAAVFAAVLLWSGVGPYDRFTWFLEVLPAAMAFALLAATWRRFPLTPMLYTLVLVQAVILTVGGHYTYARVPLGDWVRDAFGLARNHYDRLGHFAQGFVPAIAAREVLVRTSPLRPGKWLAVLVVCACLAISAAYELIEWAAAVAVGEAADSFLGTQGDPWDTQKDMALCFVGAVAALLALGKAHDRALRRLGALPQETTGESPA